MANQSFCMNEVDFSEVTGERILPFRFVLNIEDSILEPEEGEKQRFCYDVEGVGEDTSRYADLSHFLLGICDEIRQEDIEKITVVIDGEEQDVVWGENVEIKTEEKPDVPTGGWGLKIDFPLNKTDGIMQVCITMQRIYDVGPVNIWVFGGNVTATGLSICGPVCNGGQMPCRRVFYQRERVCVPVTVRPFATPGTARTVCCGNPVVSQGSQCPGNQGPCTFNVTQTLCIEIPIEFGAVVETGTASVQCGTVSETPCDCTDETISEQNEEKNTVNVRTLRYRIR